jgi:hypothetical protein
MSGKDTKQVALDAIEDYAENVIGVIPFAIDTILRDKRFTSLEDCMGAFRRVIRALHDQSAYSEFSAWYPGDYSSVDSQRSTNAINLLEDGWKRKSQRKSGKRSGK